MFGPYVHHIDPIIAEVGGVYLWWYGLGYSLGFLHLHLFLRRHRLRLGLTSREAYTLSLFIVVGVLAGARLVEVIFDEWPFYRAHPALIPAYWLGGLASHGVLLGGSRLRRQGVDPLAQWCRSGGETPAAWERAARITASRFCSLAGVLPDASQQLDTERT